MCVSCGLFFQMSAHGIQKQVRSVKLRTNRELPLTDRKEVVHRSETLLQTTNTISREMCIAPWHVRQYVLGHFCKFWLCMYFCGFCLVYAHVCVCRCGLRRST